VVRAVTGWLDFYKHESCGKCTPCREGNWFIHDLLHRFDQGRGRSDQLVVLDNVCGQILGRSFCALGDAAATPFPSAMKYFADEFEAGTTTPSSVAFDPAASTVFSEVKA
ncbi:MAG TPA: NADH-ubiquinone oxidoreductase-F iron-sulfur binding region domain-containing protein, partial [Actinomycetota bacterium]|nr:NADH-ubiquinone oxidoreductase-F iron-sulfur binding region domain-containing protein [Actinomycetota bacterium]